MTGPGFTVRVVGESEENGVYTIAIAERHEPDDVSPCVLFMQGGDDGELSASTYCVCYEPGQRASYGGIQSWGLKDRALVVKRSVGECERYDLQEVDADSVKKLEAGLDRVLMRVPRDDQLPTESG